MGCEKTRFAVARTSAKDRPEALQGFHAENLLFLIDEASGIDNKVFEVAEGALSTPGSRVLMCSNPTRTEGYFYDSQVKNRSLWTCLNYSCVDSPLVDPSYAENMAAKYGAASNVYRVRVLGEFPEASDDVLIELGWVEGAVGRDILPMEGSRRVCGLDVARFGDDTTAYVIRRGAVIEEMDQWRNLDLMQSVGRVVELYRDKKKFDIVHVDSIGLGSGVVDRLRELKVPCVGVNVAEVSSSQDRFNRLRDELWWRCREFFSSRDCRIVPGIKLIDDLIGELTAIRYNYASSGKLLVESKQDMKSRGLKSPNIADALCLTFVEGIPRFNSRSSSIQMREVEITSSEGWT
jgi:hypothetical protein